VIYYVAVRGFADREWFDLETLSSRYESVRVKAQCIDASLPGWAKRRPVLRIAAVNITEVAPVEAVA
jgi:hypothetical protein